MKRFLELDQYINEEAFQDRAIAVGGKLAAQYLADVAKNTAATTTATPAAVSAPVNNAVAANTKAAVLSSSNAVGTTVAANVTIGQRFKLYDFLRSETATRLGVQDQNKPSQFVINNLIELCANILDPIYNAGMQFTINSGWRSPGTNAALKGSAANSYHLSGLAVDMNPTGIDIYQMFDKIVALNLPFYELLLETNGSGGKWIHISYEPTMSKAKKIRRNFSAP